MVAQQIAGSGWAVCPVRQDAGGAKPFEARDGYA